MNDKAQPDARLLATLQKAGLVDPAESPVFDALTGGVSSDIWKVTTSRGSFCVKRALSKLKVAADWQAPVERNQYEVAWFRVVHAILPEAVPEVLLHDPDEMLCAMSYLPPEDHRLWKTELRDGRANPRDAAEVGRRLGRIHAATANKPDIATLFWPNDIFHAIRLEPYLEATALAHPDLRDTLFALSQRTGEIHRTMVHGDVSPKNILLGPNGPVFLDAECACMGDPAFDLAFCLNHLLLKCLWNPAARADFLACFAALSTAYLAEVDWEPADALEARAASLLPGLLLARVDGKSPAEYLTDDTQRAHVRRCARALLHSPPARLSDVSTAWNKELDA
ncbi:MAG: aminoglycoside phosphotransferase family protein [Denitromonas halophila]|nr:MAG: aminoglycoside phosphotransferase family protein [Denitromonas halophila]TVT74221.1 MAG: aminoglycoside phosphotransferase family protein [Denitromonas halophila]